MRPATADDAEAIFAVAAASDVATVGEPDWSLGAVHDELPISDGVVVTDAGGIVVAFALVRGIDARVEVHPNACGRGIGTLLVAEAERRVQGDVVRQEAMTANAAARELLERNGYSLEQRFWKMERDLDGSEPWPDGFGLRRFERGRDERAAYELISAAMADVPGTTERSFEEWSARALGDAFAAELSLISDDGVVLCAPGGSVEYVAVAERARGRGLGRALLQAAFRRFAEAGETRAHLWVNAGNESAIRLYERAGMEMAYSGDRWVKRLNSAPRRLRAAGPQG
jgi:mycothiol synthase